MANYTTAYCSKKHSAYSFIHAITHPSERVITIMLGLGICLFPIHNSNITLSNDGETIVFLPWIGFALILLGLISLYDGKLRSIDFGPSKIYIPLLVIVASAFLRVIVDTHIETLMTGFFLLSMFLLYTAARKLGMKILTFVPYIIIAEVLSIIIMGLVVPGKRACGIVTSYVSGGTVSSGNYDIAAGWVVLGCVLLLTQPHFSVIYKRIAWFSLVACAAYFLAAEELFLSVGVLVVAAIIRKDMPKKMIVPVVIFACLFAIGWDGGNAQNMYDRGQNRIVEFTEDMDYESTNALTTNRIESTKDALGRISILGHGYSPTDFHIGMVHFVPLAVMDQLGPLAALAWVFVTFYVLIKYTWKYALIAILALSIWDHYLFTQMIPFYFVILGLASTVVINDRLKHEHISQRNIIQSA